MVHGGDIEMNLESATALLISFILKKILIDGTVAPHHGNQ
jgi:hypothetical protein